jgi:hypothetical protein
MRTGVKVLPNSRVIAVPSSSGRTSYPRSSVRISRRDQHEVPRHRRVGEPCRSPRPRVRRHAGLRRKLVVQQCVAYGDRIPVSVTTINRPSIHQDVGSLSRLSDHAEFTEIAKFHVDPLGPYAICEQSHYETQLTRVNGVGVIRSRSLEGAMARWEPLEIMTILRSSPSVSSGRPSVTAPQFVASGL